MTRRQWPGPWARGNMARSMKEKKSGCLVSVSYCWETRKPLASVAVRHTCFSRVPRLVELGWALLGVCASSCGSDRA